VPLRYRTLQQFVTIGAGLYVELAPAPRGIALHSPKRQAEEFRRPELPHVHAAVPGFINAMV
jgi:hypothetical protein